MTRARRALTAGSLLLASIVAAVLLSEVAFRVTRGFFCVGGADATMWTKNPDYGWGHRPNTAGWNHACVGRKFEWEVYTTINSKGLRDREFPYERRPDTARVLLLGDSVTEAVQVPVERSFPKVLEELLRHDGKAVEVINAGVAAFSTDNELLFFDVEGRRYQPDLVLLMFNTDNDVLENSRELHARMYAGTDGAVLRKAYFDIAPNGELSKDDEGLHRAPPPAAVLTPLTWLVDNLFIVRAAIRAFGPKAAWEPPLTFQMYRTPISPEWARAWQISTALVDRMRTEVEASGAKFAVAVVPGKEAVLGSWSVFPPAGTGPWDFEQPNRLMAAHLASAHIPSIDLLPSLRSHLATTGSSGYFMFDVHLDVAGHEAVATALRGFVEEQLRTSYRAAAGTAGNAATDAD